MIDAKNASSRGYLYLFVAVTFWGGSASLAKHLFRAGFDTLIITQTRSSLSFLLLAAYFAVMNRSVFRIERGDLLKFASIGVVGVAITNYTYYFTVQETTVATAILMQYTAPVMVMLYAVFVSKEEDLNGAKVVSLLLALLGCYLAVSGGSLTEIQISSFGMASGAASALCYAFMLLASKRVLRRYSVWTMLVYAFGFATLFWLVVHPPWEIAAKGYSFEDWGIFWMFAIVSILIPHALFMKSLHLLEATSVGIASTMEPVVAIIVAYLALGEALNGIQFLGALAVVCAVALLQLPRKRLKFLLRGSDER
jgi:drug/metabolite transporter (DMT)-like permease